LIFEIGWTYDGTKETLVGYQEPPIQMVEKMSIPKYTHQQWAVLNTLLNEGELWGRDLRAALKKDGYGSTNAAFYELMDRLETAGLVEGRYEERDVLGQLFKERKYKLTGLGQQAWDEVASYYAARLGLAVRGGL
jgi:DNA-binding PadR family transcriptional regulator